MLEVITGSMFSEKTTELITRVKEYEKEGKNVIIVKPVQDSRYSRNNVVSHDGLKIRALPVDGVDEIFEVIEEEECDILAIDEVQFFGWDFLEVISHIADKGVYVLAAGLDLDFRGRPFGIMPELMALADIVKKKHAKCSICGNIASRNQRLVNGVPAKESDSIVVTGTNESITYEPRCRFHHEVRK
jgi:thymidine kinase